MTAISADGSSVFFLEDRLFDEADDQRNERQAQIDDRINAFAKKASLLFLHVSGHDLDIGAAAFGTFYAAFSTHAVSSSFVCYGHYNIEYSICQIKNRNFYNILCMDFKDILKEFLEEKTMTQVEFAKKMGVKQSQVSEWLKGKSKPGYVNLRNMTLNFDKSAAFWLGLEE